MKSDALDKYLQLVATRSFDWGQFNCCHFADGWLQCARGKSVMVGFPETPTSKSALRLVRSIGQDLPGFLKTILKAPSVSPKLARNGDIVALPPDAEGVVGSVGICAGRLSVFLANDGRLVMSPTLSTLCAWHLEQL